MSGGKTKTPLQVHRHPEQNDRRNLHHLDHRAPHGLSSAETTALSIILLQIPGGQNDVCCC